MAERDLNSGSVVVIQLFGDFSYPVDYHAKITTLITIMFTLTRVVSPSELVQKEGDRHTWGNCTSKAVTTEE